MITILICMSIIDCGPCSQATATKRLRTDMPRYAAACGKPGFDWRPTRVPRCGANKNVRVGAGLPANEVFFRTGPFAGKPAPTLLWPASRVGRGVVQEGTELNSVPGVRVVQPELHVGKTAGEKKPLGEGRFQAGACSEIQGTEGTEFNSVTYCCLPTWRRSPRAAWP